MLRVLCLLLSVQTIRCWVAGGIRTTYRRGYTAFTRFPTTEENITTFVFQEDLHRAVLESMFGDADEELTEEEQSAVKSFEQVVRGSIWFNDTIDYKGSVRFMRVYNKNPYPLIVYELTYTEVLEKKVVNSRYWRHLPEIRGYHDSGKLIYTVKDMSETDTKQKFTIVVGYQNETYVTTKDAVCQFDPQDQKYHLTVEVDIYRKKKLIIKPPISKYGKAHFHNFRGLLEYSSPNSLERELNKVKKEINELYAEPDFK